MVSNSIHIPILILTIFIQVAIATNPLYGTCFNSQKFSSNSPYEKNLLKLLSQLSTRTPQTGFRQGSSGSNPNKAYGISLCRGDISVNNCSTCVADAITVITSRCPKDKGAIIWYDNCYVKYSDNNFVGKIDTNNTYYMWNRRSVSRNPMEFNAKVEGLLSGLSHNATRTSKLYGSGEVEGEGNVKIYGMVQCSRDLSRVNCKTCLADEIGFLPSCCDGKIGGRVFGGSCSVRYEIYPFFTA